MKALTLTQPWATLVAVGAKRFETRSWSTSYRGPLAIHAAKGLVPVGGMAGLFDLCSTEPFRSTLREGTAPWCEPPFWTQPRFEVGGRRSSKPRVYGLPLGAIVAIAELTDVLRTETLTALPFWKGWNENERAFGDYSRGRFAWHLDKVRALAAPIDCRGALGLWDVPDALLPLIESRPREGEAQLTLDLALGGMPAAETAEAGT